jgi:hypothetical protein
MAAMRSSLAWPVLINSSALREQPVASANSRRFSKICSIDFGVRWRTCGWLGSAANKVVTSFPEGAQT